MLQLCVEVPEQVQSDKCFESTKRESRNKTKEREQVIARLKLSGRSLVELLERQTGDAFARHLLLLTNS